MFRPLKAALLGSAVSIAVTSAVLATGSSAQAATVQTTFCNSSSDYDYVAHFTSRGSFTTYIVSPGHCLKPVHVPPGEHYQFDLQKTSGPTRKVLKGFVMFKCSSRVTLGGTFAKPTYKHSCS